MAKPASRQDLINYCLRQLGAPVLEINVAEEQLEDRVDEALQYFHERHFDGVERMYLKYKFTQEDIDRGSAKNTTGVGIVTTTGTANISGIGSTSFNFYESSNFIQVPDSVIGIEKVFKFDASTISGGMFSLKYQLFLNDLYYFSSIDLLHYSMVKTYLEEISFLLSTDKQIRFNKRQNRMYLDIDWEAQKPDTFLVIDCYRILDPSESPSVWNDSFLKKYTTSLIKKQWGQNLIKFQGVKLPGGVELNGRQIYDDAVREIQQIEDDMMLKYELPPLDLIG
jgi:hypothetical protein